MYNPDNLTRLSQFAFPEYDDTSPYAVQEMYGKLLSSRGRTFGAHLMKHDVYHVDFVMHHHTFSLLLSDGKTRVHGHVRRYLPTHEDSKSRMDVGRRRPRAMIIMTRAMGGERFYSSVLKTLEAITIESQVNRKGIFSKKKKDPMRAFLHALFNSHATLITQYAELRRHGLSLNFTQAPTTPNLNALGGKKSACETAKIIMQENEELFRVTLDKVEFGPIKKNPKGSNIHIENDILKFYLPPTLQPGFECLPPQSIPEDIGSPIIPLLRYIGPSHFVRLLSALLCERRIILISKSITRLSMCVRAASSVLAQGLLLWRHILIPVLPPNMLRFLSVQAPYLVGILHPFAPRLGKIEGLTDVLCVNVDNNELKTLNMATPRTCVPDMLKKVSRKSDSVGAAECLARDLDEIVKADQLLWQDEEKAGWSEKAKENGIKGLDTSDTVRGSIKVEGLNPTKQSFIERMKHPLQRRMDSTKKRMSLEEKRKYETSVDAAVAFGKMIRSNFQKDADDEASFAEDELDAGPKYSAPSHDIDIGSVEASTVAENEGGEEDVRAALTCFFIHMYGDMGMYLSETQGTFWLDRRKFLLRKKQLGEKENSPTFVVLQKFSASNMFAIHVKTRIDDMSMTARDRSSIMPHHIPLFDVCSKYLTVHRLDFSLINVRRIVAKTVLACTRHIVVERHVAIRTKALALTDDTPYDGNVALAISDLVDSCHECNTNLVVVMSVIWHRLNQTEKANMHILLALHLLKNLVSHGPLTAITEALDGAGKIYELKTYSDAKSADHNNEVRQAADHVYSLLADLSSLFCRRRRIAFSTAHQRAVFSSNENPWSNYLASRLPFNIEAQKLHALFRPEGINGRAFNDTLGSGGPPSVAGSNRDYPSLMALSRLGESLRDSKNNMYDGDEEDRIFGSREDDYLDESLEDDLLDESRRSRTPNDLEEDRDGFQPENFNHGVSAEDLFADPDEVSIPANRFSSQNSRSMLENFNYAVSSHGSQYGSERSGSPLPSVQDTKKSASSMNSIAGRMRDFSFPEDDPYDQSVAGYGGSVALEASYRSGYGQASETDRIV